MELRAQQRRGIGRMGSLNQCYPTDRVRMAAEAMRKSPASTVALTGLQLGLKILPLEIFHDLCKSCIKQK